MVEDLSNKETADLADPEEQLCCPLKISSAACSSACSSCDAISWMDPRLADAMSQLQKTGVVVDSPWLAAAFLKRHEPGLHDLGDGVKCLTKNSYSMCFSICF